MAGNSFRIALVTARLCLAVPLLVSALGHIANPFSFFRTVLSYELIPIDFSPYFSATLPFLMLLVSISLLGSIFDRVDLNIAGLLYSSFAFAQLMAILRGLNIDCGCFVTIEHKVSWVGVGAAFSGAIVSFAVFWLERAKVEVTDSAVSN